MAWRYLFGDETIAAPTQTTLAVGDPVFVAGRAGRPAPVEKFAVVAIDAGRKTVTLERD